MAILSGTDALSPVRRYSNIAVAFHWVTAVLVLAQLYVGFAFATAEQGSERTEMLTWHKTIGVLILLITLSRLGYRLVNPPPAFPPDLPRWERAPATWSHRLFYFLLIVMPLSGLAAVSAHAKGPTTPLVGGIPLPVIPGVGEQAGEIAATIHVVLVAVLVVALLVHVAAALKHQFFDHIPAAGRMPPFQAGHGKAAVIGQGHAAPPFYAARR
jgi:cytochrome b561